MRRVYFIKPIGMTGPIKIGCSYAPTYRRRALETWSPFPLEIMAEIEGDFYLERRFHARFSDSHQSREWFAWTPELQQTVDEVAAGTFDINTLPGPKVLAKHKRLVPWSDERRRTQSYAMRIGHIQRKQRLFLPSELRSWRAFLNDQSRMAAVDNFIREPSKYGWSAERDLEHRKSHLRSLNTPFADRLLEQLEAA